jgi:GNAT superfamily N-acetyltransferase
MRTWSATVDVDRVVVRPGAAVCVPRGGLLDGESAVQPDRARRQCPQPLTLVDAVAPAIRIMAVASEAWDASIVIMSGALSIRVAGPDDAGVVALLNGIVQGSHYDAHPDRFLPPDAERVEPVFREWLASGHERTWLPGRSQTKGWLCDDEQGDAIGYVVAVYRERPESPFTTATRWVELDQIAVREDARAKGAGRLLALAVVEWARELAVDTLELSVSEFNASAQAFFGGLGFERLQQRYALRLPSE